MKPKYDITFAAVDYQNQLHRRVCDLIEENAQLKREINMLIAANMDASELIGNIARMIKNEKAKI